MILFLILFFTCNIAYSKKCCVIILIILRIQFGKQDIRNLI